MKKRTFYMTLALFLLFFNTAILLVTTAMLKDNIRMQKERCLAEHYVIASSLFKDMQALENRGADIGASFEGLMHTYAYFSQNKNIGLSVYHGGSQVFSSIPDMGSAGSTEGFPFDFSKLVLENRLLSIQGNGPAVLTIAGRLPEPYHEYSLAYQYDMGDALSSWRRMKDTLYLAGGIFSVALALCLLLLLGRIFRPLVQISETSQSIAAGDYENRLPLSGHDELANMSRSFNHMADEIQGQIAALQEAAEHKQRFIDNFAHELRTPLTTIYGYAEYLQKAAITEADRLSATGYILAECTRMQQVSRQLLDLAMLRGGEITQGKVAVSQLFQSLEDTVRPKAIGEALVLSIENRLDFLTGNMDLLQILLANLADNAIKACGTGGTVSIRAYRENGDKVISVQDNGKGMSQEQLAHVKEAFYRVDKARNRRDGGTGLGLSLCEQIAQTHRAKLQFSSSPGHGTTVKVIFTT